MIEPKSSHVPGSGTIVVVRVPVISGVTVPPEGGVPELPELPVLVVQPVEMVLPCSVTAPVSAMTLPHPSVALVFMLTLSPAIIFPANDVNDPMVAELPTCQYTLSFEPAFIIETLALLPVMRELLIWKTMFSPLAPAKLRKRAPAK